MVFMRFNGKLDPNFNTQWFTSDQVGVWNWSRWRSPAFDKMNAEAGTTLDDAEADVELVVELPEANGRVGRVRVADLRRGPVRVQDHG